MKHWGRRLGGVVIVASALGACGQELELPSYGPSAANTGNAGPSDGVTGTSGAAADSPSKRLPLLDDPSTPGGAGGVPHGQRADSSRGSAESRGGSSPASGSNGHGSRSGADATGEGGFGGDRLGASPPVLMFSEYVEGKGWLKALEIFAIEAGSLETCELLTFVNGKQEPTRLPLRGALAQGEMLVLCSAELVTALPAACDQEARLIFNGDDALALSCDGVILDVIGEIGVDPGESWGAGATLDHTLRRRCSEKTGHAESQQPFDIDAEWLIFENGDHSDLGARSCEPPTPSEPLGEGGSSFKD